MKNQSPNLNLLLVIGACWISRGNGAEAAAAGQPANLVLENQYCRVEVERRHGVLLRLLDRAGQLDLKSPVELAENFRVFVPSPGEPRNCVYGKDQRLSRMEAKEDRLVLCWDGPLKDEHGRMHDLSAMMRIEFEGQAVRFRFALTNHTNVKIQEVWYPAIGGLLGFGPPEASAQAVLTPPPRPAKRKGKNDGKRFVRPFGQHLATYPGQNMGFVEIDNPAVRRGLYLGAHDPIDRLKAFYFLEQGAGQQSNVAAWLIHYPFTAPGGVFEGAPLVAQFHDGDWIAGGRQIYRPWFIKTFGLMKPEDDWIRQNSFFQMVMIMLPEGNVNYTCRQIPQLARDGLKYGLTSLQIAGWQFGGHDNGYPYYEPDPRLGTWADLKRALRECHQMGVKVYFFANIHVNNLNTAWYEKELKNYNYETLTGQTSWIGGWGMGTLASRMGLTTPLMAFADTSFPGMADAQLNYFKHLAKVGADGIHIDKGFPQALNFNPRIVLSPDQSPWLGTTHMLERICRECRAIHPDFRVSCETAWDRMLSYGAGTWWAGNMSVARNIFPELVETVGLCQPYDYLGVNDAVRNGYAVMVAPFQFNRSMDCGPWRGLAGYIRDVKKVRDALADYVFTGEQLDPEDASFENKDKPAGIEHAVYRNLKNGKRAVILTNRGASPATVVFTGFGTASSGQIQVFRPAEAPTSMQLPAPITLDSERIAFLVEK